MSDMAGNISAFSTVWTYYIYGAFITVWTYYIYGAFINKKHRSSTTSLWDDGQRLLGCSCRLRQHNLGMNAASITDYVQALYSFFIAPLFGTVILGMLWKRATKAGGFGGYCRNRRFNRNVCLGAYEW
ncbi:hypothetical protein RBB79_11685 [Tunturiibacter empetritectus]|uniref:Uncharacterized protein n=2 Tax=Tunturiibacter TaxID=3154218 RepID=A0A852VG91_9BACT|nr:hypothetical protein [Edaphobacter lichenicola]NYF90241.1 hypothetical protein [Edaphobacter lichenicola]